jgi:hypothetical protein
MATVISAQKYIKTSAKPLPNLQKENGYPTYAGQPFYICLQSILRT